MKLRRALLPTAIVSTLLLATACSTGGEPAVDAAGDDCLAAGAVSEKLAFSGDAGSELTLTSDAPVTVDEVERTVLESGSGDVVADGDMITVTVTMINGATGETLQLDDGTGETTEAFNPDLQFTYAKESVSADPLLGDLLRCATEGQRAAAIVPLGDLLGGMAPEDLGVADMSAEDSIVVVTDTTKIERGEAEPEATAAEACETLEKRDERYPEVDLGDGATEPSITIPECIEPPTDLEIEVLEEGDGPTVAEGDAVMTNYVGVDWNGAVRFDGNWSDEGIEFSTAEGALIEGFRTAMIGQKEGSTVLVTMPSDQGYNDGMTRTFVLELVKIVK